MANVQIGPSGVPRIDIYPPGGGGATGPFVPVGPEDDNEQQTQSPSIGPFQAIGPNEDIPQQSQPPPPPSFGAPQQRTAQPQMGPLQQLEIGVENTAQAGGQGTTPVMSAQKPFALGPAMQGDDGNVYYKDSNGNPVPTDQNKNVVLTDPDTGVPTVYLRNDLTDAGRGASLGHIASLGLGPSALETTGANQAAQAAAQAAQRIGVNVPRAVMSPSRGVQLAGQISSTMPGGAPLLHAIDESQQALGQAVQRGSQATGGVASPIEAGEGFQESVQQALKPEEGQPRAASSLGNAAQGVQDAYGDLENIVNQNAKAPLTNTAAVVRDITAGREASAIPGQGKAVAQVQEGVTRPGGMTFAGIKGLRTSIGEMLEGGVLPEGTSQAELKRIYGALSKDLESAALATGGRPGQVAFAKANRLAGMLAEWRERIRPLVGAKSGESVYQRIINMASAKPSSGDIRNLAIARASVPEEVWKNFAASAIDALGKTPTGEFSPLRFISDYGKLSDPGKKVLFGSLGRSDLVPFLDDIATVSQRFKDAGKLANTSRSAGHGVAAFAVLDALNAAIVEHSWREPVSAVTALIGNNLMARVLSTPTTAAAMARWSNIYSKAIQRGAPGIAMLTRSSGELVKNINSSLGTNFTPYDLLRTLQTPAKSNADENQQ